MAAPSRSSSAKPRRQRKQRFPEAPANEPHGAGAAAEPPMRTLEELLRRAADLGVSPAPPSRDRETNLRASDSRVRHRLRRVLLPGPFQLPTDDVLSYCGSIPFNRIG